MLTISRFSILDSLFIFQLYFVFIFILCNYFKVQNFVFSKFLWVFNKTFSILLRVVYSSLQLMIMARTFEDSIEFINTVMLVPFTP